MIRTILGLALATAFAVPALAEPAVIYDNGGKFDKGFNESAFNGAAKWAKEAGKKFHEFEIQTEPQREQSLRNFARKGYNPIITIGFNQAPALGIVAKEFPKINFAIIDSVVDLPNVRSITFKENEGSYLVGVVAALSTKTSKVGFVGGMDVPLIRKFACGYVEGVKSVDAKIEVFQNMTGTTPSAWNDPVKAGELAKSQFDQGADVVYAAAGGSGLGVLQAAADLGKLSIGVDSNQNGLHPGSVLTSMLKRVDVAVYQTLKDGTEKGKWTSGVWTLGLNEDGVGWALDDNNKKLISDDIKTKVDKASADIKSGAVKVHDYTTDNACPAS